jgi:MFS superfamily sulfate permease-like transporter
MALLWPGALGIALMSFTESIAAARAFSRKGDPAIDANQELVALGIANLTGSFFQAYPGGGGTSQTAVNRESGAKTQIAALVTAAIVALTLLFLAPLIGYMPQATLGAMVMVAAAGLINLEEFRAIRRVRNREFVWALVALLGVVLLGTLEGILIAVLLSVLTIFYQASFPPVYALARKPDTDVFRPQAAAHPEDERFPGLLLVRTEGRMNFASAPNTSDALWQLIEAVEPRVVAIDWSAVPDLEYTALTMLTELEEQLHEQGITLWLVALNPEPLATIRRSALQTTFTDERLFFTVRQAVEAYQDQYLKKE